MSKLAEGGNMGNSSTRRAWRNRLASLVAAVAASLGVTTAVPAQANTQTPQASSPSIETRAAKRFAKLVFRQAAQGSLKVAQHESHESHSSHASHYSHYSSGYSG
jgi:hypothetical protein